MVNFRHISVIAASLVMLQIPSAADATSNDKVLAVDKLKHFGISAFISSSSGFVLHNHFRQDTPDAAMIGFTISLGLGGIKEIIDKKSPGQRSSWKDLIADFLGAAAGAALFVGLTD